MLIAPSQKPRTVRRSGLFFCSKSEDTMDKPGLRDALPQPRQSDTRNDPFWSTLDSSLSAAAAATPQPAEPIAKRDLDVGLGDVARGVGAGALDLVGGIGELARQASNFGKENAGKQGGDYLEQARANMANKLSPVLDVVAGAGDLAVSGAESLNDGMSADAKEALGRRLVDETPEGRLTLGDGAGDIDVWAMKMAQGVGSLLPTLAAGGVTGVAAKASIGRAVTSSMVKRGATQEVAEAVAAKAVSKIATGAAVTTGATGSVGSAGVNTRETVLGMSFDELAASDTFRQAFTRIDQDQQTSHLSDEEKLGLAREETANLASRATMSDAKVWGAAAMGSMMGDAMLFKMLAGKAAAGGVLKGAGKGAVGEGVGETLEEGVQQYAVNEALNEVAAADIDPMKGVVSSALEGGLIGMGTGGAVGAVGGARGGKHASAEEGGGADPVSEPAAPMTEDAADLAVDPVSAFGPQEGGELAPSATQAEGDLNPLGPSGSQFDELRDVPAYLRQDDTADRFKGMAQDSDVQRALAGEYGRSVQDLVTAQMQAGDQGKSLYELAQAGDLGVDPFAGNKSALQVAAEGQRPALPLKDVIFAGDANAKPAGEAVAAPGDHDDQQAGPGPQFRGGERTRWQSGQEGELLPSEPVAEQVRTALPGAVIEGEGREVGSELPHRDVVYGADNRQPDATPIKDDVPVSAESDSIFGPLRTLRITRKGKPFASEKEAAMASRKGKETPVPLKGGGFGVAEIAEIEQVRAEQPTPSQPQQLAPAVDTGYRDVIPSSEQSEVTHDQPAPIPAISSERSGDQPGAGDPVATSVGPTPAELAERAGPGDPADGASLAPVPVTQPGEENALTTPAPAGVAVSEGGQPEQARATAGPAAAPTPWSGMIDNPDGTITLKGEVPIIKQWAKDNGVKAIPGKGGLVVSTTSVAKVRQHTTSVTSEPVRQIEAARAEVAPEPTEAQKEAGNYKKGHLTLQGLDIALENPKGSTRSGTDQDGRPWQSTMAHDYGYIKRTQGADGDHVDVFIGDKPESEMVYVVDQVDPKTGKFDEHKVMMGFADEQAARAGYLGNYEEGWQGLGAIKAMPVDAFKRWVKGGDTRSPIAAQPVAGTVNSVRFSKQAMAQGDKPIKHLTRKEAELVSRGWFKQYRGASGIKVQIHATQGELEGALGLEAKEGLIRRAAFDDDAGTLHVAADTISDPKRMREILRHEVLAHYGLANVLGDGEYTKLMSRLIQSQKDPSMKPVWDWVNTHYADEDIGTQAEEVVAHLAELEQGAWGRGWDRVVAWVTRALRTVGFVPDGITAAETRSLIEGLGKKLRKADAEVGSAEGERLWFSAERSPWGKDFPEVILHGRLADATSHPDYAAAKGGDDAAARRLVSDVLSPDAIRQLKKVIGNREAIALGVHAEEAVSRNAIPQAMADVLGKVLGIDVSVDIVQAAKVGRTAQDGFGRLANQPGFDGPVRNDKPYLIVDDTLTQGGTLANLKGYIENRGGEVIAATALTGKQYSAKIAIDSSTLEQLRDQYDGTGLEAWWHNRFGYGFDSLTESEGRYLLRAKDADKVRDRVTAAGHAAPSRSEQESARDDGPFPPDGLKFSQTNSAADEALQKLNLGPKPDIIDKTKTSLNKLRQVDRGVVSSWFDRVIKKANTEVLDALAPIKYAEEAAGITDAADSGYVAARMATGAASTMQATMLYGLPEWKDGVIQRKAGTGEKDALLGIFADLGADLHNWLGWMAGHRAELLLAQGRENLLDAQDIAALKAQGKGKEAKFLDAKARWNRLNAATLDLAQEAGLFTKEARAEFESEWYIPFFRESDDGDVIAPFKPRGIANQNAGIKKLKGGDANTNDLLENIFTSTSKLIDASMKNMAAQKTVWNLADTGIIEVIPKPNKMDYQALANGKDRIMVKLEGEDYMIRVEDPDLYRAMTFFDRKPFGAMVNVAGKAKRLLTAGVTASPEFMLRNFLRDSLSSWAISKDGFKPMIDSIKGVRKTWRMDGSTIDVMFSGASFLGGYVNGNDPEAMADTVRKSLRRKGMTPEQIARYEKSIIRNAAHAKGVVADAWEKYSRVGEAVENGNREAVYDAAIKAGKSHAQAAFESKDLMDFSMLGASRTMQVMTQLLPFFNARVQGLGKLTRELRDNPRAIAKRAGMITAASLALLAHNWDDERYEGLPDWDKDANWHFWLGEHHWRIPKPFEIGVLFGTIPERMVRALGDKDTGAQFGKAVARAIGDTFALNPTPQLVKPMVEAAFNYDSFRGGPIDGPQDLNVQSEARYNEQTSLLMRELGALTGFSPKQLEHLVIGYTGTMGSYVMAAADGLIRAARPGESASWRADEIPLVKAVYRGTGPAKSTQHMEEFYRMLNEVNQLKRTVDQYRSEGLIDKASELLEEQGGILKSRRNLSRTQQQIRVVRNKIELIQRDRTLTAEEKRRRIDEMLARRNDLVYLAVNKNRLLWGK
ncbi:LPD38 domain-containing protein [Aeromonas caviae]|uniref:LPD38 domain-containing protein n=1 Tax=Aeromonas caviae TaxID=648 RepID=UPI002B45CBA8|nr:LPD38 domain-containing protein [Aeromonas caviae]